MSGLFGTMHVSKLGMFAQQSALNTTSHNIANQATPGYSRQHVVLKTARPITLAGPGQIGTGVNVVAIERTRDIFLDHQVRRETSNLASSTAKEKYLSKLEGIYNEPSDSGISKLLSEYFDAWQTLSTNPEKLEAKQVVVQTAKQLTEFLSHTSKQIDGAISNLEDEKKDVVTQVNTILDQLNEVNKQIKKVTLMGNNPNDLLDSRDLLLDELSTKFGIDVKADGNLNGISITPLGKSEPNLIQDKDTDTKYRLEYDETSKEFIFVGIDKDGNKDEQKLEASEGTIAGLQSVESTIKANKAELDNLAKMLAYSVNAIHNEGPNGKEFFKTSDGSTIDNITAANIVLNDELIKNPSSLNTAIADDVADGKRALAIAQLRDIKLAIIDKDGNTLSYDDFLKVNNFGKDKDGNILKNEAGNPIVDDDGKPLDKDGNLITDKKGDYAADKIITFGGNGKGATTEGYFKSSMNSLGVVTQKAKKEIENQTILLRSLLERRSSVSGVSQDEETINLIQFQHAYQANAKMISTVDELLDVVINGLKK
ncbi:flagellar hook-associated protein FlgK [Clostridium ihumii]|uniref:flagellar hook-associated protein FlgK n=1 Tax=Clostridium ihumii TaxID=1470356 RepID=UPI003D32E751